MELCHWRIFLRVVFFETDAFTVGIRKLFLFAFAKAELDDLSEPQKAALRRIIETEYP